MEASSDPPGDSTSGGGGGGGDAPSSSSTPPSQPPQPPPQPLSRYESQKRRDWNTFLQYLRNHKPPLTLQRCSGAHVIEFLKYLDQFGKTKVHADTCPHFGKPNPPLPCACPLKQAWGSLDALIGRLRAAYEESGGRPESNPFATRAVRIYLREVRESQAKARGIPYEKKKRKRGQAMINSASGSGSGSALPELPGEAVVKELSGSGSGTTKESVVSTAAVAITTVVVTTTATVASDTISTGTRTVGTRGDTSSASVRLSSSKDAKKKGGSKDTSSSS